MIEAEALQLSGIAHGFFTRGGGHSTGIYSSLNCGQGSGDDPELVQKNRAVVARQLGVEPTRLVTAHQTHSADAIEVATAWTREQRPKADGLVTRQKGLALGVLTADCGPILFADRNAGVIGACHAGWKGAVTGITDATITAMEKLGAHRDAMVAVIGPAISQVAYEVGPEFPQRFLEGDAASQDFFSPSTRSGHFMFNLPGYLERRLQRAGLRQVHDLALCTYTDEARFYSYRRATHRGEADFGRLLSAIALV